MLQPQVWLRRQEIQQQVLAGLALIKGVEMTKMTIVNLNQQAGFIPRCNPYTMEVDQERNCYSYKGFGYIVRTGKELVSEEE